MGTELATFAGGCFWCIAASFEDLPGVESVKAGFTGGTEENPTYEEVASALTFHVEATQISFQPEICSYKELLKIFWRQIDPTDEEGQFADRGYHYHTAIFYHNEEQKRLAEESKKALQESGLFSKPIVTEILPASNFYPAEEKHQSYHTKNPEFYCQYKRDSGRQAFLEKMWGSNEK